MNATKLLLIALLGATAIAGAEPQTALDREIETVDAEFRAVARAAAKSAHARALWQRLETANASCEAAEDALPGVAALERQIERAKERLASLQCQRAAILKRHAAVLKPKREAIEAAQSAYFRAARGGAPGERLLARRTELLKRKYATAMPGSADILVAVPRESASSRRSRAKAGPPPAADE